MQLPAPGTGKAILVVIGQVRRAATNATAVPTGSDGNRYGRFEALGAPLAIVKGRPYRGTTEVAGKQLRRHAGRLAPTDALRPGP